MARSIFYDSLKRILFAFFAMMFVAPVFSATLPAGYTELEYIQTDGNSWIDTGLKGHMNYTYELSFQQVDAQNYRNWGVFGQQAWQGKNMSLTWSTGFAVRWNSSASGTQMVDSLGTVDTNHHVLRIVNGEVYWDGVDKGKSEGHSNDFVIQYNLFLGTINPADTTPTSNARSKYYYYKVWDNNGNLIQDFVPVKYVSGNTTTYGMYDLMDSNFATAFHTNKGTGTFTAGPELDSCRNLYNSETKTSGYFIGADGTIGSGSFAYSDFIPAQPNTVYTLSGTVNGGTGNRRIHAYDSNKNWLQHLQNVSNPTGSYSFSGTTPANTAYIRISVSSSDTDVQLEQGSTATTYTAYNAACHNPCPNGETLQTRHQSGLPLGYTLLDYIETDGNSWFATGINVDATTELEITASNITSNSAQLMVARNTNSTRNFRLAKATATHRLIGSVGAETITDANNDGTNKFTAKVNISSFYVDGTLIGNFESATPDLTGMTEIDVFRGVYASGTYYAYAGSRLHRATIRKNNIAVIDLIPCKNASNVVGMYDLVSGQFFTNAGTGDFIASDPVSDPETTFCASTGGITIATTKYNEDAFANLVTTLNSAITKVTNIVDTTVAQATSIGTLATTKQDRPADGDCPAGRKCLLVTGTDGKPHWYLIQE